MNWTAFFIIFAIYMASAVLLFQWMGQAASKEDLMQDPDEEDRGTGPP